MGDGNKSNDCIGIQFSFTSFIFFNFPLGRLYNLLFINSPGPRERGRSLREQSDRRQGGEMTKGGLKLRSTQSLESQE